MVNMFRCLIFLTVGLTVSAQAALEVKIDKAQSPLGEPLVLQIKSPADLSTLDLSPIAQNFEVTSQTLNSVSRAGRAEYLLEATLYPLRSGVVTIPALALGTQRSRALDVRIEPAHVSMQVWFPPGTPMVREATILHLQVRDDGSFSWDTPILVDAPFTFIRALPESIREETHAGKKNTVHHFRWQILPLKAGSITVNFGMLGAHRYAQRLRFPLGNVSTRVTPAPAYLPLSLPIGRPIIRTDPKPEQLIAGTLQAWNMYVYAPGTSADGLKSLLQYSAPGRMKLYLSSVDPVMFGTDEYLRLTFSYKVDRSVRVFPEIRLPYFDLRTQRVETVTLPASPLHVHDLMRDRLLAGGAVILGLGSLTILSLGLWKHGRSRKTKYKWLGNIRAAQTPADLYTALTKQSPWRAHTPRHLPAVLNIDLNQYAMLEALRFGLMDESRFTALKAALEQLVARTAVKYYPQDFLHLRNNLPDVKNLARMTLPKIASR